MAGSLKKSDLINFEKNFDHSKEDKALHARGVFIKSFPVNSLDNLTIDTYIIGKGTESFCALAEAKSRAWANIQGATASKFGLYYGKKGNSPVDYQPSKKFGNTPNSAFTSIKKHLNELVKDAKDKNFQAVDANPISQMFKAKIISLYYPELYLNICSADHIKILASELGAKKQQYTSEMQYFLLQEKLKNKITKSWSNPKFMSFLYKTFINIDDEDELNNKKHRGFKEIDFEKLNKIRDLIGKKSEEFALDWERKRLIGLGYESLAEVIEDTRKKAGIGYDFLSYNKPNHERYIEVKSVGRVRSGEQQHRFFLSDNEFSVSKSDEHADNYFFYLVFFDKNGEPFELQTRKAIDFYHKCEMQPSAYIVKF